MNKEQILNMSKEDLKTNIESLPLHWQPKWLSSGNKNELCGYLLTVIQIPEFKLRLNSFITKLEELVKHAQEIINEGEGFADCELEQLDNLNKLMRGV